MYVFHAVGETLRTFSSPPLSTARSARSPVARGPAATPRDAQVRAAPQPGPESTEARLVEIADTEYTAPLQFVLV